MSATETAATPAPAKPKKDSGTDYIVLRLDETDIETDLWQIAVRSVTASSANEAIRRLPADQPGTYVAVPSRSWKPVKVSVETVSRVKLEDA